MSAKTLINWRASASRFGCLVLLGSSSLVAAGSLRAANTEFDVASEPTTVFANPPSLSTAATYSNNAVPGVTGDATFNATNFYSEPEPAGYTPALGVFAQSPALSIGSLNDLSTSQAITITNGNSGTQAPLTLNGGDSVSGNTADLLYVAAGATLNISNIKPNGGAVGNTVIVTPAVSGNFDVVGTATISVPIASGTQGAPTANAFGITKTGVGTLILTSVANNYTGGTTVNAGTLALGAGVLQGAVAVNAGGTFGGTGNSPGVVTVNNGGTIMAGNQALTTPTGAFSAGTLTLNTGSTFNALLTSANAISTLSSTNTIALGGAFKISLTSGATFVNGVVLQLITSPITGTFTNGSYTVGGYKFTADYGTDPSFFDVDVTPAPVPEPSALAAVCGLIFLAAMARGRQLGGWLRLVRG